MKRFTFKRTLHTWGHSTEVEKGYRPYFFGSPLDYIIMKDEFQGDWSVYEMSGEGKHVCGGLTYKEAKESFQYFFITEA